MGRPMAGDYPSIDFAITEESAVRRVIHVPSGMTIVTPRVSRDAGPAGWRAIPTLGRSSCLHVEEAGSRKPARPRPESCYKQTIEGVYLSDWPSSDPGCSITVASPGARVA
jgi:hypothetical protein